MSSTVSSNPRPSSPDEAMLNSRAARASCGRLLATVSARADEATVSTAEGANDCTVSAADVDELIVAG
eukprot:11307518-Heterocapsa_arctica.AAC.1